MPFYEYECPHCKYYAEVLQKLSDKPIKKCPSCGKAGFKRLVSAPVFRLKGSGWYETDFKSDKEGQRNISGPEREETKAAAPEAKPAGEGGAVPAGKDGADASPAAPAAKPDTPASAGESRSGGSRAKRSGKASKSTKAARPGKTAKAPARRAATRPRQPARRGRGRR